MILLPEHILLTIYSAYQYKSKQPVETQPMTFSPQWSIIALRSLKQLIIHRPADIMDDHRILGIPSHITKSGLIFLPGHWSVDAIAMVLCGW